MTAFYPLQYKTVRKNNIGIRREKPEKQETLKRDTISQLVEGETDEDISMAEPDP